MSVALQAARTYLERKFDGFPDNSVDDLIKHGLQALSASLQEGELTKENCTLGVVGLDMQFTLIEGESLLPYLAALKEENIGTLSRADRWFHTQSLDVHWSPLNDPGCRWSCTHGELRIWLALSA